MLSKQLFSQIYHILGDRSFRDVNNRFAIQGYRISCRGPQIAHPCIKNED